MPSLKSIRKRIVSVRNTQKITKAMKMVAAAKLRRAQDGVVAMRPYARRMKGVVHDLVGRLGDEVLLGGEDAELGAAGGVDDEPTPAAVEGEVEVPRRDPSRLLGTGSEQRKLVLLITSDRGLAGAYNSGVTRRLERFLVEHEGSDIRISVVGKKGREYLKRRKLNVVGDFTGVDPKTVQERAVELNAHVVAQVETGAVDAVYVIYNEFKNAATQIVQAERLLPLRVPPATPAEGPAVDEGPKVLSDFVYEPSQKQVLSHLLPLQIETEIARILLESIASFLGAQMSAMDNASRNAKEMIGRLTLQYNRARQAAITKELMEIVGGAEALKG